MSTYRIHYCYDSPSPSAPEGHVVGAQPIVADTEQKAINKITADHVGKLNFRVKNCEKIL